MKTATRHVVVALRMAGIAGQDKLNGVFEFLSRGHRWALSIYRTRHEFTAEAVRRDSVRAEATTANLKCGDTCRGQGLHRLQVPPFACGARRMERREVPCAA